MANARGAGWRTDLAIVAGIEVELPALVARGGLLRVTEHWNSADEELSPLTYMYRGKPP